MERKYARVDGGRTITLIFWAEDGDPRISDPDVLPWQGPWHVEGANYDTAQGAREAAEAAFNARRAVDVAESGDATNDSQIMTLVNQTRAEWVAWAGSNFPSLTAAERQRLGILFWVVAVGVRSSVRGKLP